MATKYPAKVSYGLLIFIFSVLYAPLVPSLINAEVHRDTIGLFGFLSLVFAFVLYLFFGTYYTIEDKQLKIKCGFFSYNPIAIEEIQEVARTTSLLASPAPSFDRIKIKYGSRNEIILSPKDAHNFVEELILRNPRIQNKLIT
ncbi:PH domain-containing protein [Aquimarina brevivitae]|uniref:PH (Pleckstrin Homology) domain-containing protein n=1 Tax=Aquimarina brevivitae TaxID=323412 RepID=A0A4Q7P2I8_9FLAO|nr:PH domain-containing protein [Aquimarina brevivitae]RZS93984.1 PH (Pleckstrin Homology) domain-containing protein [Aquimarina brevivitae]